MAVVVECLAPAELLAAIKDAIHNNHVTTWSYDSDGDFTHTPDQWENQAWFDATVEPDRLIFGIIPSTVFTLTDTVYGVYHGRFIEMLLAHLSDQFTTAAATATYLDPYDRIPRS